MVSIFSKFLNRSTCGGSIIAIKYVLTAFHCVDHSLPDLMVMKKFKFLFILVLPTNGFQSWLTFLCQFLISFPEELLIVRRPSVNVVWLFNALIRFNSFCMEFLRFPYIVLLKSTKFKNCYFQKNLLDYCWNLECLPQKSPSSNPQYQECFSFCYT